MSERDEDTATDAELELAETAAPTKKPDTMTSSSRERSSRAGSPSPLHALEPGDQIDRFEITSKLGEGGMGVVFAAYDPALDRRVAIKLLRPRSLDEDAPSRPKEWLLREAQAMARLSHPNVVVVHEVGTVGDQIFVAMEFVDGPTLKRWFRSKKRPWQEVLEVFVKAGRGLAAAHEAGLVHRDFKPDNVLVGNDGRVRVTDFGLVGTTTAVARDGVADAYAKDESIPSTPLEVTFAKTGAVFGTPSYMAPEQHRGRSVDARADQFAFCVALYEALYGQRPFRAASYAELADKACSGEIDPVDGEEQVPTWLRDIVLRGLSASPENRYPSMEALLAALESDPSSKRRRRVRIAALAGSFVVLSAVATYGFLRTRWSQPSLCAQADAKLAEVWNKDERSAIRARFLATKRPYAADTFQRAERALDGYATAWADAYTDACEATHVRGEQSQNLLDLRMACLDQRLGEMAAQIDVFAEASDAKVLDGAVRAVADLGDLARCEDTETLLEAVPPPSDPSVRDEVQWIQTQVDRAAALERAGKYEQALTGARGAAESARALDYARIRAVALLRLGSLEAKAGSVDAAERALREAVQEAARARDDITAADCWIELVGLLGKRAARYDEALAIHSTAAAAVARAGDRLLQRAALLSNLGAVRSGQGDYAAARDLYEQALSLTVGALGPDHPEVATALTALGDALTTLGEYEQAQQKLKRALAITEKALGADHPGVARALAALANVYGNQGAFEDAETYYRRALAIYERALGRNHPQVAKTLYSLGVAVGEQNRLKDALALFLRALEIQKSTLGLGHPDTIWTINSIGVILQRQDRLGLARERFREALALFENTLGKDHPNVGYPLNNLGEIAVLEGRFSDALKLCRRAHEVGVKALGADHPALAHELTCIGGALVGLRRPLEALEPLEHALAMREANPGNPKELADTRFALARALWDSRRDRQRAVELARRSLAGYEKAGELAETQRREAAEWIAKRAAHERGAP